MRPLILAVVLLFSSLASANSVPTYNVKNGTAVVTASDFVVGNLDYSFSGPGFSFGGWYCDWKCAKVVWARGMDRRPMRS